ncbi:hypothetical protein ACGFX8_23785 [Streptomyces sp. NPDC048362]|uniref:hypothetical protein n=1 Tax=unclassified Streptomyces TaxID=2593676 RepID=UPI00340DB96C
MSKPPRVCTALGLALLAATALGATTGLPHTHTPTAPHTAVQAGTGHLSDPEVNNTGSSYEPPTAKM